MIEPSTHIETEFLMRLHNPGSGGSHAIDSSLMVFHNGAEGRAEGPALKGAIIAPSGDWLRIMPSGSFRVDARVMIRTDDGALIYVSYGGVVSMSQENYARMGAGEALTSSDCYFITTPTFQTSHPAYQRLNRIQAIGKIAALKGGPGGYVDYDVFAVR
ncbi:DUF3237 domain-containing protein [Terrarubrum flagellatum]|uniref:DUF3237 domain-containing protein n=1 Tax=Terrirubrum flagellatum TaxID=2895980 RepID=UPI003144E7A6